MSERTSGGVTNRRWLALARLEQQLKSGEKNLSLKRSKAILPEGGELVTKLLLTDSDVKRITKEAHTLRVSLGLITVTKAEAVVISEVVDNPPAPNEALKRAQKNYQSFKNK